MASTNHHYIPQLYLNGFTSSNGRMQVYNKLFSKFEADKHTPRTMFFEKDKNTIIFNGVKTDKIEQWYGTLENGFGELFNSVRSGLNNKALISKEGLYLIKVYISIQFWRLPLTDNLAEYYIDNVDLKRFGERITINGVPIGEVNEIRELLKTDNGFRHYFRCFILPLLTFDTNVNNNEFDNWKVYDVSADSSQWDNFLCSDNPLIVENIEQIYQFKTKLIMPLSKNKLLIHSPNKSTNSGLEPLFSTKLAMLTFAQSRKYVAGANRSFMEEIIDIYNRVYGIEKIQKLRDEVFSFL
jgi:hypothetical protein